MKKIILISFMTINSAYSLETTSAFNEMRENFNKIFYNLNSELSNLENATSDSKFYHDETVINIAPELGVKVPGLAGLSYTLGIEYTFKRKLPNGYMYDRP